MRRTRYSQAQSLLFWTRYFIEQGSIPDSAKGCYSKFSSALRSDNIKEFLCAEVDRVLATSVGASQFTNRTFAKMVQDKCQIKISEATAGRYLLAWGYVMKKRGSESFYDGHEAEAQVLYRKDFLERVLGEVLPRTRTYEPQFEDNSGNLILDSDGYAVLMETSPQRNDLQEIVIVTHDEACAESHKIRDMVRQKDGKGTLLRKKSRGQNYHCSAALCPCHGYVEVTEEYIQQQQSEDVKSKLRPLIGKSSGKFIDTRDSYWDCAKFLVQLSEDIIPLFEALHPGCLMYLIVDNSSGHLKLPEESLNAYKLNLSDGGKDKRTVVNDGYYLDSAGNKVVQPMVENGVQKGIKRILEERGLWTSKLKLDEARLLLSKQPDFIEASQKTCVKLLVEERGHCLDYYPKYHCELNWIERVWSNVKAKLRIHCDYTFQTLRDNYPKFLKEVSATVCKRYYNVALRWMSAYRLKHNDQGLNYKQLQYITKKFKSHRRIPESIMDQLDKDAEFLKLEI